MADDELQATAQAQTADPNVLNVNELKILFSNSMADIPIFYGDHTKDSITAKFMFDCNKVAQATYHWSDAATARNFKLPLQGKPIYWLNDIKDTELIDISLWPRIETQFKSHYDIQIQMVDNVWDFSKLRHEDHDDPADQKLEVSNLINNVSSTAPDYQFLIKEAYTFA
jgi:hypothetical protein